MMKKFGLSLLALMMALAMLLSFTACGDDTKSPVDDDDDASVSDEKKDDEKSAIGQIDEIETADGKVIVKTTDVPDINIGIMLVGV